MNITVSSFVGSVVTSFTATAVGVAQQEEGLLGDLPAHRFSLADMTLQQPNRNREK